MKKLMLASMIAAAALFTACGDDDDSTGGSSKLYSCDINIDMGALGSTRTCAEASDKAKIDEACATVNELLKQMGATTDAGKTGTGCPSGFTKKCSGEKDGTSFTAYFYDAEDADTSCEELMADASDFL